MPGEKKTKIVSIRIPQDQWEIIKRRYAESDPLKYPTISQWIVKRFIYDLHR